MLTDQDVQKIIDAQRDVFATKQDFAGFQDEMRKNFSDILTCVFQKNSYVNEPRRPHQEY